MTLSNQAILEISELSDKAEKLSRGSERDRSQSAVLLQRIASIRQLGISSDEMRGKYSAALNDSLNPARKKQSIEHRKLFEGYLDGSSGDRELRDFLAGQESISYTAGAAGGFTVPFAYDPTLREAFAQVDPILHEDVTSFSMSDGPFIQPTHVSGWDLSTVQASVVGEAAQQLPQATPPVAGADLRSNVTFRASFAASAEALGVMGNALGEKSVSPNDDFAGDMPSFGQKIVRASMVALGRKIGKSVLAGAGGADISGVLKGFSTSSTNSAPGKVVNSDISSLYFSVNAWYRASRRAGWLLSDAAYKLVRNATDNQGRPLLDFQDEKLTLLGKPIFVCPSLFNSTFFSLGVSPVLFGDLSSIVIRASRPTIQRVVNASVSDITQGKSLYVARCRADAAYFDPSGGTNSPLAMALWS